MKSKAILVLVLLAAGSLHVAALAQDPQPAGRREPRAVAVARQGGQTWLARHQAEDGTWACKGFAKSCEKGVCSGAGASDSYDLGVTGLALLSFLGSGNTHKYGPFKGVVKNVFKALHDRQFPDGRFGEQDKEGKWFYNHAICTQAVAEAYGLSGKSPLLLPMAERAVKHLAESQNPDGGWRYGLKGETSDTSSTVWAIMAFKAAKVSGVEVPAGVFSGALKWLDSVTDQKTGLTGYQKSGDRAPFPEDSKGEFDDLPAMTAASVLARIFLEAKPEDENVAAGRKVLTASLPTWGESARSVNMVYWFYGAHAAFQFGGDDWKKWSGAIWEILPRTQKKDGCEAGSWDPAGAWGSAGGRVYSTALCVLCLESHFRFARLADLEKK